MVRCPHCGKEAPPPGDGSSPEAAGALVDEIRTVTVLFADVAGSTVMTARLGLEVVKSLMDRVFLRIHDVVMDHGGKVDKYIGDCVMALFGAPIAYGDDPARGVRAGLAIIKAMEELEVELEAEGLPPVKMRVGINTGPVIAGPVGAGSERRFTVLGHAVNLAAHLQQEAPVGSVLMGQGTHQRIRGLFNLQPHTTSSGKAYRVLGERSDGVWLRPREILGAEIEMVGREHEMERLQELHRQCVDTSRACLVLVAGEPGIGKSRLVGEFLSCQEQQLRLERIVSHAHPLSGGVPFSIAADFLRRRLGITATMSREESTKRICESLRLLERPYMEEDVACISRILQLEEGDRQGRVKRVSPDRVLDLLVEMVDYLAAKNPMLIIAEDLHWFDGSSLVLARHLVEKLSHRPLMIIGATGPEYLLEHPELLEGENRHHLALGPLDHDAVTRLVVQAIGPDPAADLLELISSRALGNPYHVEELLRVLEGQGVLVRRVGGWDLTKIPTEVEVPPGVESVTQARIDNLSSRQRQLLCQAAVVGNTFWDGLIEHLAAQADHQDLSTLVQRELVVSRYGSSFAGCKEYSFVHNLTQKVAYKMLTEDRRAELHRKIARWVLNEGAHDTEKLALVGSHLERGGLMRQAAEYHCRAGDAANAASAYTTAVVQYSQAIDLAPAPVEQLFDLLARRERVLNALGRWPEQHGDAVQMLELAEQMSDEIREERKNQALLRVGRALLNLGEHDRARETFEGVLQGAKRLNDHDGQARSLRWLAMYHFNLGELLKARPLFEQALALAEAHDLDDLAAELAYELGVTMGTIGDYPRALQVSKQALEIFQRKGNQYQESFCLANIGCFHVYLGECEEAIHTLEQAMALGQQLHLPLAAASAQANLGNAYRMLGQVDAALKMESLARSVARDIGDQRLVADTLVYESLAALEGNLEQQALGEDLAAEALHLARESNMQGTEATAFMALAIVHERREEMEQALSASRKAVDLLDRIGSVEGFELEILTRHLGICLEMGLDREAETFMKRSREEVRRKASFIKSTKRRRQFLAYMARQPVLSKYPGIMDGA